MLGRFLGLAFVGPLAYFGARGLIPRSLYPRLALLFGLGGGQVSILKHTSKFPVLPR